MISGTIVMLVLIGLVVFGIKNQHHHGYMVAVSVALGMVLTKSVLAGPANTILNGIVSLISTIPSAIGHAL
jgi:hypothetical protein